MEAFPVSHAVACKDLICRPRRDFPRRLPSVPIAASGEPDDAKSSAELLMKLAEAAEAALQIMRGGFSSIGLPQAGTTQQITDGAVGGTQAAGLGRLLAELGEMLLMFTTCRRCSAVYVVRVRSSRGRHTAGARGT
ncbi:hypothetical protein AB4Y43_09265 [Paraburkholderia sp. BR10872]|uniref:hypothetical protein n=1 Tax=Paraburkholderia sp. BR10872 TaxID=3236989 RepID=UPI0034D24F19